MVTNGGQMHLCVPWSAFSSFLFIFIYLIGTRNIDQENLMPALQCLKPWLTVTVK